MQQIQLQKGKKERQKDNTKNWMESETDFKEEIDFKKFAVIQRT